MIELDNRIGIGQIAVIDIEGQIIEIDLSMDKAIKEGLNMVRTIEKETLGKEIIKEHRIIEDKPLEKDYRGNHGNSNFDKGRSRSRERQLLGNLRRNIEVALGQDQFQEQVPIETELDALSVGNMIILQRIVQM